MKSVNEFLLSFIIITTACVICDENSPDDSYSFLVKIEAKGNVLGCAGTILTSCAVLTSAHCVEGVQPFELTVTHAANIDINYTVNTIVTHPNYKKMTLGSDIAILQINENFTQPWTAVSINDLPINRIIPQCSFFQILGWPGHVAKILTDTYPVPKEKPMKASIKLISNSRCLGRFKKYGGVFLGREKLCGVSREEEEEEEESKCFTGPGGPLLCAVTPQKPKETTSAKDSNHLILSKETLAEPIDLLESFKVVKRKATGWENRLQVGVVSWGKSCSKVPSIYIRTDFYYEWILQTLSGLNIEYKPQFIDFTALNSVGSSTVGFHHFPYTNILFSLFLFLLYFTTS